MAKPDRLFSKLFLLCLAIGSGGLAFSQATPAKSDYVAWIRNAYVAGQDDEARTLRSVLDGIESKYKIFLSYDIKIVEDKVVNVKTAKEVEENNNNVEKILSSFLTPLQLEYK